LGKKAAKNLPQPIHVWSWKPEDSNKEDSQDNSYLNSLPMEQDIRFCMTSDGVQIAYATVGSGPPLVKAPNWMHHLEYEWKSPIWRHLLKELARDHTLVRFDQRANGLSDWNVDEFSLDAFARDLATVVEAVGLERFPLLGISQGCAISIKYVVENPEKVSHLILYGGFARGRLKRSSPEVQDEENAMLTLMRVGWGQDNPAFRQMFTSRFIPGATKEQMDWFNELQRISVSPKNAILIRESINDIDITPLLSEIHVPTLVMHCRGDAVAPFEEGRRLAASIPNARFVPLDGDNHLILEHEPSWPRFLEEVRKFLEK
jgi:pimeloyl-ACP methyl ester carboxylesterase